MSKLISQLYQLARVANDVETLLSMNPKRIARRLKNKVLGRAVASRLFRLFF
jgi:hypothetical protein